MIWLSLYIAFWVIVFIGIAVYVDWITEPFQRQLWRMRKRAKSWDEVGMKFGVTGDTVRRWSNRTPWVRGDRYAFPPIPAHARIENQPWHSSNE